MGILSKARGVMNKEITILLPDNTYRTYLTPVTGLDIAIDISPSLAKAAYACSIDDQIIDIKAPITEDCKFRIFTSKDVDTVLDLVRHSCAHIMAYAVQELWPNTQVAIGPVIKDGFYYDFSSINPFSDDDLPVIEQRMREIIARNDDIRFEEWNREDAIAFYTSRQETYKIELVNTIPVHEQIRMYWHGGWQDLCRGPHIQRTGQIPLNGFKLMKVAGAYWRGDSSKPMLQRIYGTAWLDAKSLNKYLQRLEEASKRDHRKIGKELELFHLQEESTGMVFWHSAGWNIWLSLESYLRKKLSDAGYIEVRTPQLADKTLWEKSGHWEKFRQSMFITEVDDELEKQKSTYALKPMNCPCHVQIFNHTPKSYRQLPLRMAEFGSCHRYEPSGAMHGIMRVRGFTQDDAHIFCTEEQIEDETRKFIDLLMIVYKELGFDKIKICFSDRPEVRSGTDQVWDKAEDALKNAIDKLGYQYSMNTGEGAFYGPKLEFILEDAISREWQCGTFQVDFVLPDRLGARYTDEHGSLQTPVMLHRAILGSFERFIGILTEHYAGRFPIWMAPQQVAVATIVSDADDYAMEIMNLLKEKNIRAVAYLRNEKINAKIRDIYHMKIPIILVVGRQEVENRTVVMRRTDKIDNQQQSILALNHVIDMIYNCCCFHHES